MPNLPGNLDWGTFVNIPAVAQVRLHVEVRCAPH